MGSNPVAPTSEKALFSAENGAFSFVVGFSFHGELLLKVIKNQTVLLNLLLNGSVKWMLNAPPGGGALYIPDRRG